MGYDPQNIGVCTKYKSLIQKDPYSQNLTDDDPSATKTQNIKALMIISKSFIVYCTFSQLIERDYIVSYNLTLPSITESDPQHTV